MVIMMKKWKYKLPIIVGVAFFLLSLPFILGLLTPSIHEGNYYAAFYVIVNILPTIILGKLGDLLTIFIFKSPTLYQSTLVFIFLTLLFWISVSWILGSVIDRQKRSRKLKGQSL